MRRLLALVVVVAGMAVAPAAAGPGEDLYGGYCLKCHGVRGAGIEGKGPPLRGAGAQAADFYLRTGYMPLRDPRTQPWRQRPFFGDGQIAELVRYVASLGGPRVPTPHPQRGNLSEGQRLFTENCAACHQVLGVGGIVTGARVPSLARATPTQIAEAVRIGPYVMPRFSRRQISDAELDSLIRYVEDAKSPHDVGGWGIGHLGPIPEGMVAWLLAGTALVGVAVLIGRKARS